MPLPNLQGVKDPATLENLQYVDDRTLLPQLGVAALWPTAAPPPGWRVADGAAVSRAQFAELFATIGIAYGSGNGTTTFNLPDLAGTEPLAQQTWIVRVK